MKAKTILTLAFAGLFAATAATAALTGVTVNGVELDDAVSDNGMGWAYDSATYLLTLDGAGPVTLSGENWNGKVRVVVSTNVTATVTLSNLTLEMPWSAQNACAFALETNANVSLILEGENTLGSGNNRAGLEVPAGASLSITNAPGDDVAALGTYGGSSGAGIGGGSNGAGGTVTISGGWIFARGGSYGAGIGGGQNGDGGTVTISGGRVSARGNYYGAGIGGGRNGDGGTVAVSGGTVFAQGDEGGADIGTGSGGTVSDSNTFTGGSIKLAAFSIELAPSNGTAQVGCAIMSGFNPNASVTIEGLPNYGVNDIVADGNGTIYLWLPDGDYTFTANGSTCTTKIKDGVGPTGVTVNGEEAAFGPADPAAGWNYDAATHTVSLTNAGPFTLSGKNELGFVCVTVPQGVAKTVTLSNLTLRAKTSGQCAFALKTGASVSLVLAGTNTLTSASDRAGIEVAAGASLSITNAPGDDAGTLLAYGGDSAAGIGSGNAGAAGAVTVNGGAVMVRGGSSAAGIGSGSYGTGGEVTVNGGIVVAQGGYYSAGIGAGYYGAAGSLTVNGGEVIATGDFGGAGIGGGRRGAGGIVTITGGTVTAEGGGYAAGIGGGGSYDVKGGAGGMVTISGGQVWAYGSAYAAGIGGGGSGSSGGAGGEVTVSGGTVFAQGNSGGADIGPGRNGASSGTNVFTGGSICLAGASASPAPSNNTARVACAVVSGFEPDAPVVIEGLPSGYGVNDIFADAYGCIYVWLPNNTYTFTANERDCVVKIQGGVGPTGVTVNGEEVAFGPAGSSGWSFDGATCTLLLSGAGPFTLSGANAVGGVCVTVPHGVANTVTLSNLTLRTTGNGQCVFALETNAVVSLFLAGTNVLASGPNRAGLEVMAGRTLFVTNAPNDGAGALFVYGGNGGAGIGGGYRKSCGTVTLAGGAVTAESLTTGDYGGAGVGGGGGSSSSTAGAGGDITITGGSLMATGGNNATGIGGGACGTGGSLTVSGGTVAATGEGYGAGVGGGYYGTGGEVTVTGGSLTATGGEYGAGIGGGYYGADTDGVVVISNGTVTATGGSSGGAGIGGGYYGAGGTVRIVDGQVTAVGGASYGAGIGGGYRGAGGAVEIEGGRVVAIGGSSGAGIGGGGTSSWGVSGAGGTTKISGGTVFAQGAPGSSDIGPGRDSTAFGTNTFTGGSICLAGSSIAPVPSNGTVRVACAVVSGFEPYAPVTITAGLAGYGVNDIFADDAGCIYLWLPDDTYTFTANGRTCEVKTQNGVGSTGVTVNGEEVAFGPAVPAGWSYDPATHTLSLIGTGPFTLSGANAAGGVCVVVAEPTVNAVVLSNLTLRAAGSGQCVFALEENVDVALVLAGSNALASGFGRAGLEVAAGRTLTINHAPSDVTGALTTTSGYGAAGIGGGSAADAGVITINGGVVTAIGSGNYSAGIGGGGNAGAGTITIHGGTVTAIGARLGAGIGTGGYAARYGHDSGTITINGGTVTATGGELAAGIGGGDNDPAGTVAISGGRVTATGGRGAAGIGGGGAYSGIGGAGADLTISGGTVFATGGTGGGPGIGGGVNNADFGGTTPNVSGTSLFTGGSIRIDGGYAAADPSNTTARVWCVTVPNLTPGEAIVVASLEPYGVDDLFADDVGQLYLWLPNGAYGFTAGGTGYTVTVDGAAATATGGGGIPAPVFATDGSGIVVSGTTLSIKIANAQVGAYYTLYWTDTLGGTWNKGPSIQAATSGDLVLTTNIDATASRRFFKVRASETQP